MTVSNKIGSFFNQNDQTLKTQGPANTTSGYPVKTHVMFVVEAPTPWYSRAGYYIPNNAGNGGSNSNEKSPLTSIIVLMLAIAAAVVGAAAAMKKLPKQLKNLLGLRKVGSSLMKIGFGILFTGLCAMAGQYYGLFYGAAFVGAKAAGIAGGILGSLAGVGLGVYFGKYMSKLFFWVYRWNGTTSSDPYSLTSSAIASLDKCGIDEETATTMLTYLTNKWILHKNAGSSETTLELINNHRKAIKRGSLERETIGYFNKEMQDLATEKLTITRGQIRTSQSVSCEEDYEALVKICDGFKTVDRHENSPSIEEQSILNNQVANGMNLGKYWTPMNANSSTASVSSMQEAHEYTAPSLGL